MYLFLIGRDPNLSLLELYTYFKTNKINYTILKFTNKYLLLDFKARINPKKMILDLGGTTRIINMYKTTNEINKDFIDYLDFNEPKKFNFAVSSLNVDEDKLEEVVNYLKAYFKSLKVKAIYKIPRKHKIDKKKATRGTIINPDNYYTWKLDNGFELFVLKLEDKYYFGKTVGCFNPKQNIFKDKNRPLKRNLHSTSFRLTRIMVNLLGLAKNKKMLDPFCGTGTFLIEGLLSNLDVIGIDKSSEMCVVSKKNVEWAIGKFKLKNTYKVINSDSTKTNFKADAVVFEPYMGPFLDKLPNHVKAKNIVSSLSKLYYDIFKNLNKNLKSKSKIVCVLPEIRTYDDKLFNISNSVFLKNSFQLVDTTKYDITNPISYNTPSGSKINRYIYILEKI